MEKLESPSLEFILQGLGKPELIESYKEFVSRRESLVRELREVLESEKAERMLRSVFSKRYTKGQQLVVDDNGGIFFKKVHGMSIDDIRARAKELGVDVSDLGRKKAEMLSRIEEAEKNRFQEVVPGTLPKV